MLTKSWSAPPCMGAARMPWPITAMARSINAANDWALLATKGAGGAE